MTKKENGLKILLAEFSLELTHGMLEVGILSGWLITSRNNTQNLKAICPWPNALVPNFSAYVMLFLVSCRSMPNISIHSPVLTFLAKPHWPRGLLPEEATECSRNCGGRWIPPFFMVPIEYSVCVPPFCPQSKPNQLPFSSSLTDQTPIVVRQETEQKIHSQFNCPSTRSNEFNAAHPIAIDWR